MSYFKAKMHPIRSRHLCVRACVCPSVRLCLRWSLTVCDATARRIRQPPRAQLSGEAVAESTGKNLAAKMKPDGRKASGVVDSFRSRNTQPLALMLTYII